MVRGELAEQVRHEPGLGAQEEISLAETWRRAFWEAEPTGPKPCRGHSKESSVAEAERGGKE